jgi:transcription initiation factor TFIIH subunit 1
MTPLTSSDARQQGPYSQIDLDDLHDPEASAGILLEMQDRQRYFEGQMANASTAEDLARRVLALFYFYICRMLNLRCHQNLDIHAVLRETKVNLDNWEKNLAQVCIFVRLPFGTWY